MSLGPFLRQIAATLAASGVPAMLTGSVASAFRGAMRATMDIDLVIDPTAAALEEFVDRIEALGLYISRDAARDALAERTMFNVIDPESGWKADLIVRKARPFSHEEFARREPVSYLGVEITIARAEDLILAKLEWASLGASARQLEDVRELARLEGSALDQAYIARWAVTLGVGDAWAVIQRDIADAPSRLDAPETPR
jgi:hypothetical protein